MFPVTVTFELANWVADGIANGNYERIGGVIRNVSNGHIVTFLRESFNANTGISQGLADTAQALLNPNTLGGIGQILQATTAATSVLNLGVSVMGFSLILHRLAKLEKNLNQTQEILSKINRKIDISFYANFRAALDLAVNAFTMNQAESKKSMALLAINRFLEAEHIYTDITDLEIAKGSQVADEYLMTLYLAYVAEARCYLELGELPTGIARFQDGVDKLGKRVKNYVNVLLTTNPAHYLHPEFKGKIDLKRLTKIYQWIDPKLDENAVFEMQRANLFEATENNKTWVKSLPTAIYDSQLESFRFRDLKDPTAKIYPRLIPTINLIESLIETHRRFESFKWEIQAINKLGISFTDWMQLTPTQGSSPEGSLMYIIPAKPLALTSR